MTNIKRSEILIQYLTPVDNPEIETQDLLNSPSQF